MKWQPTEARLLDGTVFKRAGDQAFVQATDAQGTTVAVEGPEGKLAMVLQVASNLRRYR